MFPDAKLKFFITATPEARARRRYEQRIGQNQDADYDRILQAIKSRDEYDSNRKAAPLSIPDGAIYIDTSDMNEDEVINLILEHVKEALS